VFWRSGRVERFSVEIPPDCERDDVVGRWRGWLGLRRRLDGKRLNNRLRQRIVFSDRIDSGRRT
jgi:hypothetical protein